MILKINSFFKITIKINLTKRNKNIPHLKKKKKKKKKKFLLIPTPPFLTPYIYKIRKF